MTFLENNRIQVDPPKRPKKCTATRFATILGLNEWSTPFSAWCEITRTYEAPFEDSIYTIAGKAIEPKVCEFLRNKRFMDIKSPTDVYGADYFKKTWGDFFPQEKELGGMWDFLGDDFVVEVKTTNVKNITKWLNANNEPDPPIYYKLQACLYAYLLGFDNVIMTCSFLEDSDYANPENYEVDILRTKDGEIIGNTIVIDFKVSEAFPTFKESYVEPALKFWRDHVETGISPEFDEKRDAEILKVLRKNTVEPSDKEITKLINEADKLQESIDKAEAKLDEKKKRLKEIDDQVKKYMSGQFRDGDKKVEIPGKKYDWTLTKSERTSLDSKALKADLPDVFGKYTKKSEVFTLKKAMREED